MGPKGPKKFFVCNDLENIIPLFNTFHLRYYIAIHVTILILPVFGCPLLKGAKQGPKGPKKFFVCNDL